MKRTMIVMFAALAVPLAATRAFAQEHTGQMAGGENAKGYISGLGGFATSASNTTGDISAEAGVRVAPHVMVFGSIGHLANLAGDVQPTLDAATASLAANESLQVIATGSLPATYYSGGVRVEIPTSTRVLPYVLGSIGMARLNPLAQFSFSGGTLPDGSTPAVGTDITSTLADAGLYVAPSPSNASMYTFGGGAQFLTTPHWVVDAGYRYSHIGADTTLSTTPLSTNGMTFGVSYRF
jgi:opacity protein-like surface antigen